MTDEALNTASIVLIIWSVLVVLWLAVGTGNTSNLRSRAKQLKAFEQMLLSATGHTLCVDWMRYKAVPKERIVTVANKHGWHHVGDEISGRSWFLNFDENPHAAVKSAQENEPHKQLRAELAAATPDVQGRYVLDTSQYGEISESTIKEAARTAGWQAIGDDVSNELTLARPVTTTDKFSNGPFLEGESPDTLRSDPAVVERAREIERVKGFDPLSQTTLNYARERNKYWSKSFNRQGLLATFYAVVGFLMLGITIGSVPEEHPAKWIAFAMTGIVLALCAIAITKARIIHKKRKSEFGDVIAAYQELQQLYRQRH